VIRHQHKKGGRGKREKGSAARFCGRPPNQGRCKRNSGSNTEYGAYYCSTDLTKRQRAAPHGRLNFRRRGGRGVNHQEAGKSPKPVNENRPGPGPSAAWRVGGPVEPPRTPRNSVRNEPLLAQPPFGDFVAPASLCPCLSLSASGFSRPAEGSNVGAWPTRRSIHLIEVDARSGPPGGTRTSPARPAGLTEGGKNQYRPPGLRALLRRGRRNLEGSAAPTGPPGRATTAHCLAATAAPLVSRPALGPVRTGGGGSNLRGEFVRMSRFTRRR